MSLKLYLDREQHHASLSRRANRFHKATGAGHSHQGSDVRHGHGLKERIEAGQGSQRAS